MTGTANAIDELKAAYRRLYDAGDDMIHASQGVAFDSDRYDAIIRVETKVEEIGVELMQLIERMGEE